MENASAYTTTPERATETNTFDPHETLNPDAVEALRQEQYDAYQQALATNLSEGYSSEMSQFYARNTVKGVIANYLHEGGLDRDNDQYTDYHGALMGLSINELDENDWKGTIDSETGERNQTGREKARATYEALTGKGYYDPIETSSEEAEETPELSPEELEEVEVEAEVDETSEVAARVSDEADSNEVEPVTTATEVIETDPMIEASEKALGSLRAQLAKLSAKRQKRFGGSGGKKYEAALEEYNEKVRAHGRLVMKDVVENEDLTQDQKNAEVISYIFSEQQKLREESKEIVEKSLVSKAGEWLRKGNVATRIGKAALVGVGFAAAGSAAGVVAGAALGIGGLAATGGAIATGVAMITKGGQLARSYAVNDAKNGRGMQQLERALTPQEMKQGENDAQLVPGMPLDESGDYFKKVQDRYNEGFELDTKAEQKKRRKAAGKSLATIAIFGGAVSAAVEVADHVGAFDWLTDKIADASPFGNKSVSALDHDPTHANGAETPTDTDGPSTVETPDTADAEPELTPEEQAMEDGADKARGLWNTETTPDTDFDIASGEGGIAFFQSLGLSEADWYNVAGELQQNFPNEFYNDGGDVRFVQSGQLSPAAQEFIKQRFSL